MGKHGGIKKTMDIIPRAALSPLCHHHEFLSQKLPIRSGNNSNYNIVMVEDGLRDEDLRELKGCIELGFGFNEEDGQGLCTTIPALDLYFAVNRNRGGQSWATPMNDSHSSWKICNPGDDPRHVKTKLRHWAQAVACSVRQSSSKRSDE